ncbi:hypothetical protein ABW19_dt0203101 [Dactylella cylindrospora]|nr:hypothetical protein ABW19_dt0203101 [Dactylella cylindrospora]
MPAQRKRKSTSSTELLIASPVPVDRIGTDVVITVSESIRSDFLTKVQKTLFCINPYVGDVRRVWIYTKDPVKAVTHVITLGPMKIKGEINPDGLHHAAFNAGSYMVGKHKYKAAYNITSIHELDKPLEFARIIDEGWTKPVANGNVYLDSIMAGELRSRTINRVF